MIEFHVHSDRNARYFADARRKIDAEINKQFRKRVLAMFNDLLRSSPQWSGDFASNWRVNTTGSSQYVPNAWKGHTKPIAAKQMGDMDSIRGAISRANLVKFDYKTNVYFTNATPISFDEDRGLVFGDGQPYAGAHFGRKQDIRAVNIELVTSKVALASYIRFKYGGR